MNPRGILFAMCVAALALPASAQEPVCTEITPKMRYCSDIAPRNSGTARAIFPDLIASYTVSPRDSGNFTTSAVALMPVETPPENWTAVGKLALNQLMVKGTAPAAKLRDIAATKGNVDGVQSLRLSAVGLHADGTDFGHYRMEALPMRGAVLLVYTFRMGHAATDAQLDDMHAASVASIEIDRP
ncbi:hypothetical protein [Sulfitobacter sp. S190]|uniref:hypothetical protein n=1 Tax=Sulfitobacter sp. S190 TaxID=2867022 RepID=UPI0021A899DA|nr:hypothetical protein [Sulfitobacter sp. S190]UWR23933.1 hypothetical protein K3756_08290 [Sulfitobacter sp. S190]